MESRGGNGELPNCEFVTIVSSWGAKQKLKHNEDVQPSGKSFSIRAKDKVKFESELFVILKSKIISLPRVSEIRVLSILTEKFCDKIIPDCINKSNIV